MADRAENEGVGSLLASQVLEPTLGGLRTNLYMNFMTNTWRRSSEGGAVGLVHPESHFVDPKAGGLRAQTYSRLRRHWQFQNEMKFFEDVHNETEFGVHVYAGSGSPRFRQAVGLFAPATVDRSLDHDGSGPTPGFQHVEGGWDLRPHSARIVTVDETVLTEWVSLFDEPGTPPDQSRLLRPLTQFDLGALSVFALQPQRLGEIGRFWTSGFNEKIQKDDGTFEWNTEVPESLNDCILQGPHIMNGTPFAQQPRENCRSNKDWDLLDLEVLPTNFIPRSTYQRLVNPAEFARRQTTWDGEPYTARFREAHREWVSSGSERTVQSVLVPRAVPHLYTMNSIAFPDDAGTSCLAGLLSSLPFDYLVKVLGVSHLTQSVTDALPIPSLKHALVTPLLLRTLRLNCLTSAYADLWVGLFDSNWLSDCFVAGTGIVALEKVSATWSVDTPLRTDLDRWLALCEIDAIVALMLGLSEEQLLQMYRSQFYVLRKYEYVTVFDRNGRQISGIHHNHGFHQAQWESDLKLKKVARGEKKLGMWDRVQAHIGGDTTVDLGPFVPPFVPADREGAMSKAYRAFEQRMNES